MATCPNVPATQLTADDLTDGAIGVLDLMVKCKLAPSKKEARRLVEQGGVEVNGGKVAAATASYTAGDLSGDGLMIKKGKKSVSSGLYVRNGARERCKIPLPVLLRGELCKR